MKRLFIICIVSLLFFNGCFGVVVFIGKDNTDVIKVPYSEGDCVERAVDLKRYMDRYGYEAVVVAGRSGDSGHAWVKYRRNEHEKWRIIDPNDYLKLFQPATNYFSPNTDKF